MKRIVRPEAIYRHCPLAHTLAKHNIENDRKVACGFTKFCVLCGVDPECDADKCKRLLKRGKKTYMEG